MGSRISFGRRCKAGTFWRRRSGENKHAMVLRFEKGVVTYTAPWSKTGVLRKSWDAFDAHYRRIKEQPK